MAAPLEGTVLLSGVGQSTIARTADRSEAQLTYDAISRAVADAGLEGSDIDGLATAPGPSAAWAAGFTGPDLHEIQDALGIRTHWEGTGVHAIHAAVAAVASGMCRHAVVYRTTMEGSGAKRAGRRGIGGGMVEADGQWAWLFPVGAISPVNWVAMYARRHMHEYGITRQQLGWLVVTQRAHAARNPDAVYQAPLTIEDYLAARPISTPLSLFDCDVPVDASTAFVISSDDTVQDLRHPVRFEAISHTCAGRPSFEQWEDMTTTAAHAAADRMWSRTDLTPSDVDVLEAYDGISYLTMLWLEALQFCGKGESGGFVEGGTRIGLGGALPLNTWGGQLSAGRIHLGFGHMAEAVRQLRGEAGPRQVAEAEVAVASAGGPRSASCTLLTRL